MRAAFSSPSSSSSPLSCESFSKRIVFSSKKTHSSSSSSSSDGQLRGDGTFSFRRSMVRCSSSSSLPDEDINKMVKKEPSMPPTSAGTAEVKTILGTMTFGWSYSSEDMQETASEKLLEFFIEESGAASSVVELDTASAYAGGNTEEILGRIFSRMPKEKLSKISVATKANPWGEKMASVAGEGGLQSEKFRAQVGKSLSALHPKSIDILYLHAPDSETTLFEVLETAQGLYRSGAFKYLGLSNMSAWEVVRAHALCKENQWVMPTIYQGMYNALTRQVEPELIPALKSLNLRFVAYNPLAGGLLTGKHEKLFHASDDEGIIAGRFKNNEMYKNRFWNEAYFEAVEVIRKAAEEEGITPTEASLRWMYYNSKLSGKKDDAVIIGASSIAQCRENLLASRKGPLSEKLVNAFDEGYELVKSVQPPYFRGYFKL
tara:strand:+ start:1301 stop:2596 length:1296 start_codon:yes stop_codon:yes gene_type:complete